MPRVKTEEEVLQERSGDWRARADALSKAVAEFVKCDTQATMMPRDREIQGRRAVARLAMTNALADYLRTT
jgi:hypothetical protein